MKLKKTNALFPLVIVISIFSFFCASEESYPGIEKLTFTVQDSLIEKAVVFDSLKMSISPPAGWYQVDQSFVVKIRGQLEKNRMDIFPLKPIDIFNKHINQCNCIISTAEVTGDINLDDITKKIVSIYKDMYPEANILDSKFQHNGLIFHQIVLKTDKTVIIKLINATPETPVYEVDYIVPFKDYESELKAIESSIGSIKKL